MTSRTTRHPLLGEAAVRARLARRYRRERLFRGVCLLFGVTDMFTDIGQAKGARVDVAH